MKFDRTHTIGRMTDRVFRLRLKRELDTWVEERLITLEQAENIKCYHAIAEDEVDGIASTVMMIFGLALLGGGVLSLIVWYWLSLATNLSLVFAILVTLSSHVFGSVLISRYKSQDIPIYWEYLGHSLRFFGTLLLGAVVALSVSTLEKQYGYQLSTLGLWAIFSFGFACIYRSTYVAALSLCVSSAFCFSQALDGSIEKQWLMTYALMFTVAFPVLAWWLRSTNLYALSLIATPLVLSATYSYDVSVLLVVLLSYSFVLLAYSLVIGQYISLSLCRWAEVTAILLLALVSASLTFETLAEKIVYQTAFPETYGIGLLLFHFMGVLGLSVFDVHTRGKYYNNIVLRRNAIVTIFALISSGLLITAVMLAKSNSILVIVSHITLLGLIVLLITSAVFSGHRVFFWLGCVLAVLNISLRLFEYQTSILVQSIVFTVFGLILIGMGIAFESSRRKLKNQL